MQLPAWVQLRSALRENGLLLAMLNLALAFVCAITFFGVLAITGFLSGGVKSSTATTVRFPLPELFLLYVVAFVVMWTLFAKGLQPRPRYRAIRTGLLGATPLFGLGLLGYLGVAWIVATGDFVSNSMLDVTVFIYGILSSLILLAGVACMAVIAWFSPRPHS
jgi:hypothetical protein